MASVTINPDMYGKCLKRLSVPPPSHVVELLAPSANSSDSLIGSSNPHFNRALSLAALRILHLARQTALAYSEQFQRQYGTFHPGLPADPLQALKSKNLPILVGIYSICSEESIPLRHWFRAQFDILHKMKQVYLVTCSGPNALRRYRDWASKQEKRYVNTEDRKRALDSSLYQTIETSILDSHLVALRHWDHIKSFDPPSLGAAILVLYPQVSAWYLVSHQCVRELIQDGLWSDPVVVNRLNQYKKLSRVRSSCEMGLDAAIELHGKLEL